jgi:hypothetical protein
VRCVLFPNARPVAVQILQDRDLVLTEQFPEEWVAVTWATAYAERLKAQGWHESPSALASGA